MPNFKHSEFKCEEIIHTGRPRLAGRTDQSKSCQRKLQQRKYSSTENEVAKSPIEE
jgi:hypothetical protein